MNDQITQSPPSDALIETIAAGFQKLHEDSSQQEANLKQHYEFELKLQQQRNLKWKMGAYIASFAIIIMGYLLHKTINVFEGDMNSMSHEMVNMSGYMKSMSSDISTMNGNIGSMAPNMNSMATDMSVMSKNMELMGQDMGQMNNAMSPLMGNMQKFVPGNW